MTAAREILDQPSVDKLPGEVAQQLKLIRPVSASYPPPFYLAQVDPEEQTGDLKMTDA